jgi:hypothetical protein
MKQLTDFIFVKNIIPKELCDLAISKLENHPDWQQNFWFGTDAETKDKSKELDVLFSDDLLMFNSVIERGVSLYKTLHGDIAAGWGRPRLNKYSFGQEMSRHTDLIRRGPNDGIPTVSFIGVLNDDFMGGDFIMFDDMKIDLKQGDILMFPSTFLYPHKVTEITKGTRYSVVTWIY